MKNEVLAVIPQEMLEAIQSELSNIKALLLEKQTSGQSIGNQYVDTREAAKMLSVTPHTLGEWRKAGVISASKVGRKVYYKVSSLVDLIERNHINK